MAKTKPGMDAHAKKSVSTNAMFKKVDQEPLPQKSHHMKDTVKKITKLSKNNKGYKPKHAAKDVPEHTLAAEFAGKIWLG